MRVYTGTYVGNGTTQRVAIGARPAVVLALGNNAQMAAWHSPRMWCGRSNVFSALDSINQGCAVTDDGFSVGPSVQWNESGITFHYVVLVATDVSDFDVVSHMGNATANTTYAMPQVRQVVAAILKRDSTRSGVIVTQSSAAATLSSAGTGTWVTALGGGSLTVTAENEVNELDGPGGLGEETTVLGFYESPNVLVATYVGGLPTGTTVAQGSGNIKAAIVYRVTPGGGSARFITDTTAGLTKPAGAAALQSAELSISGNRLNVGAPATGMNVASVVYGVLLLCDSAKLPQAPAVIRSRGKRAVYLSGNASSIDCGTADGALLISGPITIEWCGAIYPVAAQNTDCPLLVRHSGSFNAAGSASWGLSGFRSADSSFAWPGLQANVVTSDRFINSVDIRNGWRTGVALPYGKLFMLHQTHLGGGSHQIALNGQLVKQRKIDAVAAVGLPNIASVSGHRTTIGARYNGSAMVSPQRMLFRVGRVYNRALSIDEMKARSDRILLDSNASDVTNGLAEEWSADNAFGSVLRATINATNNGAILGGGAVAL